MDDEFLISSQDRNPPSFWFRVFWGLFLHRADDKLKILPFVCSNVVTGSQIYGRFSEKGRRLSSQVVEMYFWR